MVRPRKARKKSKKVESGGGVSAYASWAGFAVGFLAVAAVITAPADPVFIDMPPLPELARNELLTGHVERVGEGVLPGPESLVNFQDEFLFAGLVDGRVVRKRKGATDWETVARTGEDDPGCGEGGPFDSRGLGPTCGRPLGMRIVRKSSVMEAKHDAHVLVVADAYLGLLCVSGIFPGERAEVTVLASRAEGDPEDSRFMLLDDLVQAPDGTVYVTELSRRFHVSRIFHAAMEGRADGRVIAYKYDAKRNASTVRAVADGLLLPNGMTLSHDGRALIFVSGGVRVMRLPLSTVATKPRVSVFTDVLPGVGDNLRSHTHTPSGRELNCYWVALGSRYSRPFNLLDVLAKRPLLRKVIIALLPYRAIVEMIPKYTMLAVVDEEGDLVETYQDPSGHAPWMSEAVLFEEHLWWGSWYSPFLARVPLSALAAAATDGRVGGTGSAGSAAGGEGATE